MSIAFREVFKEFTTVANDKNGSHKNSLIRKDRISDVFHLGEKLLLSRDNMRPMSRSKTSVGSCDFLNVSPCGSEWRLQYSSSASAKIIRHNTDVLLKNQLEIPSIISVSDNKNDLNSNARDNPETLAESLKKGRRSRKRNGSNVKNKKGKHGRVLTAATGLHEKRPSAHSQQILSNTQHEKPSRSSSEPPSKVSQASVLSYTLQDSGNGFAQNHVHNVPFSNKNLHDIYPLRVASAKTNSSTLPSTHYMHGNLNCNPIVNNLNSANCLESPGQPVLIYKLEMNQRVKSASSSKSDAASKLNKHRDETEVTFTNTEEISVNAVSCNLQLSQKLNKPLMKYQQKSSYSTQGLSTDLVSKEAVLTSIYGAVYHTADKVSAQAEELKKVKKIFLSEKQSGTIRESGMEFPCAPPATPTPDLLRKHEYVPSMSDIRSQRAVKSRLQVMEKEALKKQEKQKEANAKLEKQQQKDKEKQIKAKQRKEDFNVEDRKTSDFLGIKCLSDILSSFLKHIAQMFCHGPMLSLPTRLPAKARDQSPGLDAVKIFRDRTKIYALNKVMTELENKRFTDFCQAKGLNKL